MSLSLFVSSPGLSGRQSNGPSATRTKGAMVSSVRRLPLGAAVEMSNGAEMRKVSQAEWNCWHLIFLSFPLLKPFLSQNILYMCRSYVSSLLAAFHPRSTTGTQHMLSRKLLLVSHLFCRGSVLFVWTYTICFFPNLLFSGSTEGDTVIQPGWRSLCVSVLWLLSLLSQFFSSLKVNLMFKRFL